MDQVKIRPKRGRFMFSLVAVSLVAVLLLMFASAAMCAPRVAKEKNGVPRFIAYYFYTNKRCGPCTTIERLAREAIEAKFGEELKSGTLQWQALNVEQPENKHFIEDFQLYTKSVIIAEYKDGKPVRWQNLPDVWKLYRDKQKYHDYVARETRTFMEKK